MQYNFGFLFPWITPYAHTLMTWSNIRTTTIASLYYVINVRNQFLNILYLSKSEYWPKTGVSNLLTKCAKILAKNLEWAIIVHILCDVLWG